MQRDGHGYGFEILRAKLLFKPESTIRRRVDADADDWVEVATA